MRVAAKMARRRGRAGVGRGVTMQLTRYTDFSLRVLMYLALAPDRRVTISEISRRFEISRNHLMKVVHGLSTQGFVATFKGKNGGMCLARPATEIRVGDVVRATEGVLHAVDCDSPPCPLYDACTLRGMLSKAMAGFLDVLDGVTIGDLTESPGELVRLVG